MSAFEPISANNWHAVRARRLGSQPLPIMAGEAFEYRRPSLLVRLIRVALAGAVFWAGLILVCAFIWRVL